MNRTREKLLRLAKKLGVSLRPLYARVRKFALISTSAMPTPIRLKRAGKARRKLRILSRRRCALLGTAAPATAIEATAAPLPARRANVRRSPSFNRSHAKKIGLFHVLLWPGKLSYINAA
jgi:hypothetical protein